MKRLSYATLLFWPFFFTLTSHAATYSGGSGTSASPYQIATTADWQTLMSTSSHWSKYFILTADIDLNGITMTSIGNSTTNFTGSLNGNSHTVSNATISASGSNYIGLFGYVGSGGQIRNLGVENISVQGNASVGGLCGYNYGGTLNQCYITGTIAASAYNIGGICGINNGTISQCYTTATVTGSSNYVGGLCGTTYQTISRCYSTGPVTGKSYVGGFCAYNPSSKVSNCFWDTQTSGQTSSLGGTGQTTEQMQTLSTFTDAGWDFTNETTNGSYDYWRMCEDGVAYPQLNWQANTADFACPDGVEIEDMDNIIDWWMTTCNTSNNYCGHTDMNLSGKINLDDIALFAAHWMEE